MPTERHRAGKFERRLHQFCEWIGQQPKPLGLLATGPRYTAALALMCRIARVAVPSEVALLSSRDLPFGCEAAPVPLSAIDNNEEEKAREAVELLLRLQRGEPVAEVTWIPPGRIVERQSTDVLAVPSPLVAEALRYMWDHLDWPLTVDQVARTSDVSRSTLERAFRRYLGRGVNAELRRKRLERAAELLRGTQRSVAEVAEASGFGSRDYLHRAFHAAFGATPAAYRRDHGGSHAADDDGAESSA